MFLKILILTLISLVHCEKKIVRYDNFTLYKITPKNEEQVLFLKDLNKGVEGLDFWKPPTNVGDFVSLLSPPELKAELEHKLNKRSIYSEVIIDNIQEALEAQVYSRRKRDSSRQLFWDNFQTYDQIVDWLKYLAETYSDIVSLIVAGTSIEGRDILGVKISRSTNRPIAYLQGGDIGADWISPAVLTYTIDQLVKGDDPEALAASENYEWHIVPLINPDGHVYTNEVNRLWLKNRRRINSNSSGVDLTKNWNSQWAVSGGSFQFSANNYLGLGPFSEMETRSVSNYVESIGSRLSIVLDFKAFGQKFIIPFAHTDVPMYNYDQMLIVGRRAMGSLSVKYDTRYDVGLSKVIHDGATGAFADWAKHRFNPPVVATYLLRDVGLWGYIIPPTFVQPSCEETFDSILAVIREARLINLL